MTYGPHAPGHTTTDDLTYACTALCFNETRPPLATKCQCATCLGTDPCDPRCDRYADCGQSCDLQVQIDTAECFVEGCSCGNASGVYYGQRATGSVRGPVGTYLQVNAPKAVNGTITCGSWSRTPCRGSDLLVCCMRETEAQAETSSFDASFFVNSPPFCSCGGPKPEGFEFVAQAIGQTMGVEALKMVGACP